MNKETCPKCGKGLFGTTASVTSYKCGTRDYADGVFVQSDRCRISELERENAELKILYETEQKQGFYHFTKRGELEKEVERYRSVLKKLHGEVLASDFNEHWESYTEATALLQTKGKTE